jgi:hypothetical protein
VSFFLQGVWENPYRHQKVLISNLSLTVFVKHQINWLNRFRSLPSGKGKKTVKRQKPQVSGFFCPLSEQKPPDALSPFIENIYASQDI